MAPLTPPRLPASSTAAPAAALAGGCFGLTRAARVRRPEEALTSPTPLNHMEGTQLQGSKPQKKTPIRRKAGVVGAHVHPSKRRTSYGQRRVLSLCSSTFLPRATCRTHGIGVARLVMYKACTWANRSQKSSTHPNRHLRSSEDPPTRRASR